MKNQNETASDDQCRNSYCEHLARIADSLSIMTSDDPDQAGSLYELRWGLTCAIKELQESIVDLTDVIREIGEKF